MFRRTRTRVIAGVATVAVVATTFLAVNPMAHAALQPHFVGGIESTPGATTVFPGGTAPQAAGDWISTTLGAVEALTATDSFGIAVTLQDTVTMPAPIPILTQPKTVCKSLSQAVSFAATPTVTNLTTTGPGSQARFAAKLFASPLCASAGINDSLAVYATVGDAAGAKLKISGITYKVGQTVPTGPIPYEVATGGTDSFTTAHSNAVVSNVKSASTAWQTLFAPNDTSVVPAFTIQETVGGAIGGGGVCVTLAHPPTGATFLATPKPSITATGGTGAGVPGLVTVAADGQSFGFAATQSTAATTYTVHGLGLKSVADPLTKTSVGPVDVDITAGPCAVPLQAGSLQTAAVTPGQLLTPNVRLGTVGAVARFTGANRYDTAAEIAVNEATDSTFAGQTVVIARGDNFPDALAASYLAGQNGVPILLTRPGSLPVETQGALAKIGATDVVLVGGTSAISSDVENALKALPVYDATGPTPVATNATLTVTRVAGTDRYDTAKLVAEQPGLDAGGTLGAKVNGTCTAVPAAIVASGENFPDALAAGGLAYSGAAGGGCGAGSIPMLLTARDSLSASTAQAISDLKVKLVLLVGGPTAVSTTVESQLDALSGVTVKRVAGDTRQDTAIMLDHDILGNPDVGNWDIPTLIAVRPDTFPDALAASTLSGQGRAPIYLTASSSELGDSVQDGILAYPTHFYLGGLIGGTDALTDDVFTALSVLLASQPG